jgi:Ca2+-binding EF-hand superfamily protein
MPVAPGTPAPHAGHGGGWASDRTRQQAQQMADGMFQRFDINHDGVLTREEAQQALAAMPSRDGGEQGNSRAERMLGRMFGDAPSVTLVQFEGQAMSRFDREDLNHDGVVTAAERQQGRANRGQ